MKKFDAFYYTFYYIFIIGAMILSVINAPMRFIEHNALAGWLWVGVFWLFLLTLFYGAIKNTVIEGVVYETSLGTIIAWICIIGQWIIIFTSPNNGIYYNFVLALMALGIICVGMLGRSNDSGGNNA